MSRLITGIYLPMQERASMVDAMLKTRNTGITISGLGLDRHMTWSAGVFGDSVETPAGDVHWSRQLAGRVTWLPFVDDNESRLVHLGLGLRYTDAIQGVHYQTESEFNRSPVFVDTGLIDAERAWTLDLEASWRRGPFWVGAEFLQSRVDAPAVGDPVFGGFSITGSWIVSGEMRNYDRRSGTFGPVPVSKSVFQGGKGALEAAVRFSSIDLNDALVEGGAMDVYSLGLNWWLTPAFGGSINFRHVVLDRFGITGSSNGLALRVLLMLD
jgi:phosphate-selective porin OprO/OprP